VSTEFRGHPTCIPTDVASPDPLVLSYAHVGPAVAVVLSAVDVESLQVWLKFLFLRGI
jgi:hypothetical protein